MRNYFILTQKYINPSTGVEIVGYSLDSRDYGVYISGAGTHSAPAQKYSVIAVPGRNGNFVLPEGAYENGTVTYTDCFIDNKGGNFREKFDAFRAMLMRFSGYAELVDTYHDGYYREVYNPVAFEPVVSPSGDSARFTVEFSAKPQRWLNSGRTPITKTPADTSAIRNPTVYHARPLLAVYGTGFFEWATVEQFSSQITQNIFITVDAAPPDDRPLYIDSQDMACYYFSGKRINWGTHVQMISSDGVYWRYPEIYGGTAQIFFDPPPGAVSNITKIDVTPRWWTL